VKRSGKGVEFAALAAAAAVLAAGVWPVRGSAPAPELPPQPAIAATFTTTICASNPVEDTRPDPAWVSASFENDHCWAPAMPAALDGYSASREDVVAGMAAAKSYAAQSAAYRKCISDFAARRSGGGKSFQLVENHRLLVSEKNQRIVDGRINAAIEAFNEYGSECPG
jgi:hypothetical protein